MVKNSSCRAVSSEKHLRERVRYSLAPHQERCACVELTGGESLEQRWVLSMVLADSPPKLFQFYFTAAQSFTNLARLLTAASSEYNSACSFGGFSARVLWPSNLTLGGHYVFLAS